MSPLAPACEIQLRKKDAWTASGGGNWVIGMILPASGAPNPFNPARARPIRVLCVDDNELIGDAVEIKLELARDQFEWLGQLMNANDLVQECLRRQPDVVLLDIEMPGVDSIEALRKLSEFVPHVHVLMLTSYVRRDLIERAIESGAWGYLSKESGGEAIIKAIVSAANGEFVMGPEVALEYRKR